MVFYKLTSVGFVHSGEEVVRPEKKYDSSCTWMARLGTMLTKGKQCLLSVDPDSLLGLT